MKRLLAILLAASCLLLSGCGSWMKGNYVSITPYMAQTGGNEQDSEWISNKEQLLDSVRFMVNRGITDDVFFIRDYSETDLATDIILVRYAVMSADPIGAYAVQDVTFEVGVNAGRSSLMVSVDYSRQKSEILKIKRLQGMENALNEIADALNQMDPELVFYVEDYEEVDFVQAVEDYAQANPDLVMELPQVSVSVYPASGDQRVVELDFTYQNSRDELRKMQSQVKQIFESAKLYVSGDESTYQALYHLYVLLMERSNYRIETSITPAYSLLRYGVGDSKAFSMVFAAMCRKTGLECMTVSGTRNGDPWFWNIVKDGDRYCHVDILRCAEQGAFQERADGEMYGYVWDYSAYPVCEMPVLPTEATETEEPDQTTAPAEITEDTTLPGAETDPTEAPEEE